MKKSTLLMGLALLSIVKAAEATVIYELEWLVRSNGLIVPGIAFVYTVPDFVDPLNRVFHSASELDSCTTIFGDACRGFKFEQGTFYEPDQQGISFYSTSANAGHTQQFVFHTDTLTTPGFYDALYPNGASLRVTNTNLSSAAPIPTTLALFGLGLAGLGFTKRKNRSGK